MAVHAFRLYMSEWNEAGLFHGGLSVLVSGVACIAGQANCYVMFKLFNPKPKA